MLTTSLPDSSFPFINSFSEAAGDALSFAPHSLSFKRNLREVAELYGCENSLQVVEEHRRSSGLGSIMVKCFKAARISAILIDDGLKLDKMHDIEWHKNFTPFVGRILRIERLAESILDKELLDGSTWTLDTFTETFMENLSVAAYRSGLEINTNVTTKDAEEGLAEVLCAGKPVRITNKSFIDYIFTHSLEVALQFDLPMQIHTGFGDKDLDLRLSNPLHLRMLLEDERFSKCHIVLLHASYPFSKEASYLASVYPQVYLDFGLAVPKLSVHGMISSLKELLELAPMNKVMFSTDGYAFPETYYLGAKKTREIIFSVLRDACCDGDVTVDEATEAAKDILARNAIKLYKINIGAKVFNSKDIVSANSVNIENSASDNGVSLVRILWVDASGQHRCRVVPVKRFNDVVKKNGIGLTFASMAMTSSVDGPADETNLTGVGEIRLMPDLTTKRRIPWMEVEEMVLADMHLRPGEAWEYCPREALRRVSKVLKDEFNLVMNAGFENEFVLLKSVAKEGKEEWLPIDSAPYCSASGYDSAAPIFHEVVAALQLLNITVEQLHAEAGKGQFEVALGHTACTCSADNLVFAREVIRAIARKHGLLATFVPKYALDDIGSGSHVHISLWQSGENVFMASGSSYSHGISTVGEEFMAGVLIISLQFWPSQHQFQIVLGKENREAPIRTACPPGIKDGLVSNFEIKSFDGCANPYLGLAAILAAGIDGLRRHLSLPEPVDTNPSYLDAKLKRLPKSLSESLEALEKRCLGGSNWEKAYDCYKRCSQGCIPMIAYIQYGRNALRHIIKETSFKRSDGAIHPLLYACQGARFRKLEVILTTNVEKLGKAGQTVKVAPGHFRNHLMPKLLAVPNIDKFSRLIREQRKIYQREEEEEVKVVKETAEDKKEYETAAKRLSNAKLTIRASINTEKFRARASKDEAIEIRSPVTEDDIVKEVARQLNVLIERDNIHLPSPLTTFGEHEVQLRLPKSIPLLEGKVNWTLTVKVRGGACNYKDVVAEGYGLNTAALSEALFKKGQTCGACYEIKCTDDPKWCKPGQPSLFVTGTDLCPPNPSQSSENGGWCNSPLEHFDIAKPVFNQISDYSAGIIPIQYRRVPCQKKGGIKFTIMGNPWFNQVIVWNVGGAGDVVSVQVKGNDKLKWTPLERDWGSTWKTSAHMVGESLTFRVRASDGRYSTSWHIAPKNWQFGQTFEGKNFK
ncbi:hypothetical protein GH714_038901 [Hevea brasiliensis]|uniref:Uncharacterized protein n=1 Tax=Hevea brasiliensis TaxID=3981 RepID=A0A6A6KPI5_HEVBR|nr:hypothetical protein GH714_038901 [Hevea brasiliensis]